MTLQEIQSYMTEILKEYLNDTVAPEKYFFLDKEYFFEYQGLSYNFFPLSNSEKTEINALSEEIFKNFEFKLISNSFKNNSNLKGFNDTKNLKFKSIVKEYLLYYLLKKKNSIHNEIQRLNFLYVYINYILEPPTKEDLPKPAIEFILKDFFENYFNSGFSEDLKKKIDHDKKEVEKELRNKEVKNFKEIEKELRNSLNELKRYNFLFTKIGYSEKLSFYYQINKAKSKIFQDLLGIYSLPSKDMELFYRGQPNSRYDINASLSRSDKLSYFEDELYYEILSLKPLYFKEDKSVYENLITMQHFGLPTRLIDLSRNALISLYFACSGEEEKDGAVYVIPALKNKILNFDDKRLNCLNELIKKPYKDIEKIDDYCEDCTLKDKASCKSGEILKKSYIVKGLAKNERITNQSGDFIFVGIDEKSKCAKNISPNDVKVEKILIIDSKSKEMILQELKQFNIHTGTVYPDLQNMSSHLKNEFEKRDLPLKNEGKENYTQSEETKIIFTAKASALSPNEIFNDISFELFYNNFMGCNEKYKEKLENLYISYFRYICDLNEDILIDDIENNLIEFKSFIEKSRLKKLLYSIFNSLKIIIYLKSTGNLKVTIVEKNFDWISFFSNPYNFRIPIYNENDFAVIDGCELQRIENEGLVLTIKEKETFSTKYLNFNKLVSYSTKYNRLILIMDYKEKPLFKEYRRNGEDFYAEPVKD